MSVEEINVTITAFGQTYFTSSHSLCCSMDYVLYNLPLCQVLQE